MRIQDPVYGSYELPQALEKLLQTPTVQRLGRIRQGGAAFLAFPHLTTTRLEHSIGVAHLIHLLGGSVEEQVAGLLHDISHTAFSHVSDYLFENKSEDFHEHHKERFVLQTEISSVLKDAGIDPHKVIDESLWPRLESPLPNLCADRVDYTLRDYVVWARRPAQPVRDFVRDLHFVEGVIVLKSKDSAQWFRDFFTELNDCFFKHPKNLEASVGLSNILKAALREQIITVDDLFRDEEFILNKIAETPLQQELNILKNQLAAPQSESGFVSNLSIKNRRVDPWVLLDSGNMRRLSEI